MTRRAHPRRRASPSSSNGPGSGGAASISIAPTGATTRTRWRSRWKASAARFLLHAIFNAYWEPLAFELPPSPTSYHVWRRCIDTALASPDDICHIGDAPEVSGARYVAQPRSVVVLALGPGAIDRHDGPGGRTGAHEPDWRQ